MLFTGEYEHTIDPKNRLAIPSQIRDEMNVEEDGTAFYLTLGANGALRLYPEKGFKRLAAQIQQGLVSRTEIAEFETLLFPLSSKLELDSAGRVKIPERMMERAKLDKHVVLIGVRDHLEIRDAGQWEAELKERLAKQSEIFQRFAEGRWSAEGK